MNRRDKDEVNYDSEDSYDPDAEEAEDNGDYSEEEGVSTTSSNQKTDQKQVEDEEDINYVQVGTNANAQKKTITPAANFKAKRGGRGGKRGRGASRGGATTRFVKQDETATSNKDESNVNVSIPQQSTKSEKKNKPKNKPKKQFNEGENAEQTSKPNKNKKSGKKFVKKFVPVDKDGNQVVNSEDTPTTPTSEQSGDQNTDRPKKKAHEKSGRGGFEGRGGKRGGKFSGPAREGKPQKQNTTTPNKSKRYSQQRHNNEADDKNSQQYQQYYQDANGYPYAYPNNSSQPLIAVPIESYYAMTGQEGYYVQPTPVYYPQSDAYQPYPYVPSSEFYPQYPANGDNNGKPRARLNPNAKAFVPSFGYTPTAPSTQQQ